MESWQTLLQSQLLLLLRLLSAVVLLLEQV
jgi:hypothetical protein